MREGLAKVRNILLFSLVLPVMYGCQGGGSSDLGSLFGSSSGTSATSSAGATLVTGDAIAQIHNPEPATMVLLGTGVIAMGYINSRKKARK